MGWVGYGVDFHPLAGLNIWHGNLWRDAYSHWSIFSLFSLLLLLGYVRGGEASPAPTGSVRGGERREKKSFCKQYMNSE
jgi:hypothetical protein